MEINGVWLLATLITLFGALGGIIFSLEAPESHMLCLPSKTGGNWDSGFLGHTLIGIGGAFVAIAGAIPVFDLPIQIFETGRDVITNTPPPNGVDITTNPNHSVPPSLLITTLYVIGISVLGGYSGLKIISGLSNTMLRKLQKDLDEKTGSLRADMVEINNENIKELSNLRIALNKSSKENTLLKGSYLVSTEDYDQGLIILDDYIKSWPEEAKPYMWKGVAYKRQGEVDKAIESAIIAIKLDPQYWLYSYNLACYFSIKDGKLTSRIKKAIDDAIQKADITDSIRLCEYFKSDPDFNGIRDTKEFQKILKQACEDKQHYAFCAK